MRQSTVMETFGRVAPTMMLLFALCVSGASHAIADYKPPSCVATPPYDATPYKAERFVTVAPGVKLEVLDWGGPGEAMVLLTGSGDNAHVFDYFAFQFTDFFHVIGITRRGWLPSSQPKTGYDVARQETDKQIRKAVRLPPAGDILPPPPRRNGRVRWGGRRCRCWHRDECRSSGFPPKAAPYRA